MSRSAKIDKLVRKGMTRQRAAAIVNKKMGWEQPIRKKMPGSAGSKS